MHSAAQVVELSSLNWDIWKESFIVYYLIEVAKLCLLSSSLDRREIRLLQ